MSSTQTNQTYISPGVNPVISLKHITFLYSIFFCYIVSYNLLLFFRILLLGTRKFFVKSEIICETSYRLPFLLQFWPLIPHGTRMSQTVNLHHYSSLRSFNCLYSITDNLLSYAFVIFRADPELMQGTNTHFKATMNTCVAVLVLVFGASLLDTFVSPRLNRLEDRADARSRQVFKLKQELNKMKNIKDEGHKANP